MRIGVAASSNRDMVGCEYKDAILIAGKVFLENARSHVRFREGGLRMQHPVVGQRIDKLGFKSRVNACLACQLAVVVENRMQRLREIASIVRQENSVMIDFAPAAPPESICKLSGIAINLPDRIAMPELGTCGSRALFHELLLETDERVTVVSLNLGIMMRLFFRIFARQKIRIGGMRHQIVSMNQKVRQ